MGVGNCFRLKSIPDKIIRLRIVSLKKLFNFDEK